LSCGDSHGTGPKAKNRLVATHFKKGRHGTWEKIPDGIKARHHRIGRDRIMGSAFVVESVDVFDSSETVENPKVMWWRTTGGWERRQPCTHGEWLVRKDEAGTTLTNHPIVALLKLWAPWVVLVGIPKKDFGST